MNCNSESLEPTPNNTKAVDLVCPACGAPFQLKSKSGFFGSTVADGAYSAMLSAIRDTKTPNLVLIGYQWPDWRVLNLTLIPYFAFPESSVVPRQPLSSTARRAGWTGCNIDLRRITREAKIPVVQNGTAIPPSKVRADYSRLKPLVTIKSKERGWMLDVLNLVSRFGDREFRNQDVYRLEHELQSLHPSNSNIRAKVRQQLQVLRDLGLLIHLKPGSWIRTGKAT